MRILLIGGGGREHALARQFAADPTVTDLVCAPGNPGIAELATLRAVDVDDPQAIAALAADVAADLVVIGPEAPLVAGAADAVRAAGIACFGPSQAAAAVEGSKAFAKDVMASAAVPTARSRVCTTPESVAAALDEFGAPYVVKADGLAAGKGVAVVDDRQAALAHAESCKEVLVEEFLDGPEVSLFVICDADTAVPLLPAQDYKRVGDGGTGPNTGGMGAYAPLDWAPPQLVEDVMATVARPTLAELRRRGTPFHGVLYCGLALTATGCKVVEFNCRFGDPETQAVLELLDSSLAELLDAAARGRLADVAPPRWRDGAAVNVVVAAEGYPGQAVAGRAVSGADLPGVLHAGTARAADGSVVSAGGRVLNCVATGPDLAAARAAAYRLVDQVGMDGAVSRSDVAADVPARQA